VSEKPANSGTGEEGNVVPVSGPNAGLMLAALFTFGARIVHSTCPGRCAAWHPSKRHSWAVPRKAKDLHLRRLYVLTSFPADADPVQIERDYMQSPGFKADMEGFDRSNIVRVETTFLAPTDASPLR